MNSSLPLVSIIIPVYNGMNYLSEAIDSALAQTYENIEIIVVNDGSIDQGRTKEIALSYGDKVLYFEKKNGGVASALNIGIRFMKGDYFAWLSHDDIYHPNNISKQIENIRSFNYKYVSACSTSNFSTIIPDHNITKTFKKEVLVGPLDFFKKRWIYGCSLLIPKDLLNEIGGFNSSNKTAQDIELVWEILRLRKICLIGDVLVFRRIHDEQGIVNPVVIKLNIEEISELVKRKINDYGIEYFSGNGSSKLKKASVLLFLASKYASDKRIQEIQGFELIEWLLNKSVNSYPYLFPPLWLIKKVPTKWFIFISAISNFITNLKISLDSRFIKLFSRYKKLNYSLI